MKTKIILGLATLATLALPAMADDGARFRGNDRRDVRVVRYDRDHARNDRYWREHVVRHDRYDRYCR